MNNLTRTFIVQLSNMLSSVILCKTNLRDLVFHQQVFNIYLPAASNHLPLMYLNVEKGGRDQTTLSNVFTHIIGHLSGIT